VSPALLQRSPQGDALISAHAGAEGEGVLGLDHYEAAIASGADFAELDVRRTADGVLVAHHDPGIGGRAIAGARFAELGELAACPPRVIDVIQMAKGRIRLHVDIKEPGTERALLDRLGDELGTDEFIVTSLEDHVVANVKAVWPDVRAGLSLGRDHPRPLVRTRLSELFPLRRAERCGADFLAAHHRLARLGVLRRAAGRGLPVFVWTVNDRPGLIRLLGDARATGIVTDHPALAVALRQGA
jgi:glycerophosphoryl diester phosphodiesterase